MKKTIYLILSISLMVSYVNFTVYANTESAETKSISGCNFTPKTVVSEEFINDDGNKVVIFNDSLEIEHLDDGSMILRDYNNAFNADLTQKQPRGWFSIGVAIFSVVNGVVGLCSNILYLSGHDVCRIALSYMGFGQNDGDYRYLVSGNYIPGCEPSHSLPCNSGYYEYRVEKA